MVKNLIRKEVYYCVADWHTAVVDTAAEAQEWVDKYRDEDATYRVAVLEYWG